MAVVLVASLNIWRPTAIFFRSSTMSHGNRKLADSKDVLSEKLTHLLSPCLRASTGHQIGYHSHGTGDIPLVQKSTCSTGQETMHWTNISSTFLL